MLMTGTFAGATYVAPCIAAVLYANEAEGPDCAAPGVGLADGSSGTPCAPPEHEARSAASANENPLRSFIVAALCGRDGARVRRGRERAARGCRPESCARVQA